jgi:hypothetical protein
MTKAERLQRYAYQHHTATSAGIFRLLEEEIVPVKKFHFVLCVFVRACVRFKTIITKA